MPMKPPRAAAAVFETSASTYDAWYDSPTGRVLFATEAACLQPLVEPLPQPRLEIGVGTGRFAQALDVGWGIDPAQAPLHLARDRGIHVIQAVGEALPFLEATFGGILLAFTLCFVADPALVLTEARRVLRPDGGVVLGLILGGTPWANVYTRRGAEGHPIYQHAHFHTRADITALLHHAGLREVEVNSTLRQPPNATAYVTETARPGDDHKASFTAIRATPVP